MSAQLQTVYSKEEERGARLNYLLCDVATGTCYDVFHKRLGNPQDPMALLNHFSSPQVYRKLRKLKSTLITNEQWNLLFPHVPLLPDSRSFDITLWHILLRNICSLPEPLNGWNNVPNVDEKTLSANLVRLRLSRNRLRGHIASTSLSESDFNKYWDAMEEILIALGCSKVEIEKRKTGSLDPSLITQYNNLLNDLQKREDLRKEEIDTIKGDVVDVKRQQRNQGNLSNY